MSIFCTKIGLSDHKLTKKMKKYGKIQSDSLSLWHQP
jgi:hypothetical protein